MAAFDREGKNIARSAEDPERDRKAGAEIMFMEKRMKRDDKAVEEAEEEANRAASRRVNEVSIFVEGYPILETLQLTDSQAGVVDSVRALSNEALFHDNCKSALIQARTRVESRSS